MPNGLMATNVRFMLALMLTLVGALAICGPAPGICADVAMAETAMTSLSERDSGRTIFVKRGDAIRITLSENATTGYRWMPDKHTNGIVELLSEEPDYEPNTLGSGGSVAFVFRGIHAGKASIALKHWRSWEGEKSVTKRFEIDVVVNMR